MGLFISCYFRYAPFGKSLINNPKGDLFMNSLLSIQLVLSDFFEDSYLGNPLFAIVANSFPSVDTFLLIGAVLLSYSTMKELDKKNGGSFKFWALFYFHRYVRLTGVYAIGKYQNIGIR